MRRRKERTKHSKGYTLVRCSGHPFANGQGRVPEHRLVMEKSIGRVIDPRVEDVHHIDENKTNNAIENLLLVSKQEHSRIHHGWWRIGQKWYKKCRGCGLDLSVIDNFYKRSNGTPVSPCIQCVYRLDRRREKTQAICVDCQRIRVVSVRTAKEKPRCKSCTLKKWHNLKRGGPK